jgi:hypothetical protein
VTALRELVLQQLTNTAGTANRRGNRTRPQELWVEFLTVRNNQD